MSPQYQAWIDEHYPTREAAKMACAEATARLTCAFPELHRVRGYVLVFIQWRPHWWCETPDGEIVDPTAHQWIPAPQIYEARDAREEEPIGKCAGCGVELYNSEDATRYHCAVCLLNPVVTQV